MTKLLIAININRVSLLPYKLFWAIMNIFPMHVKKSADPTIDWI